MPPLSPPLTPDPSPPPTARPLEYAQPLARKGISLQASPGLLNVTVALVPSHKQFTLAVFVAILRTLLPIPFIIFLDRAVGSGWAIAFAILLYVAYAYFILLPIYRDLFGPPTPRVHVEITPTSLTLTRLDLTPQETHSFPRDSITSVYCDLNLYSTRKSTPYGEWALGIRRPSQQLTLIDLGLDEENSRWLTKQITAALGSRPAPPTPPPTPSAPPA